MEDARHKDLEEKAEAWGRAEAVRRFVVEIERRARADGQDASPAIRAWLAWAAAHAERLDPLSRGIGSLLCDREAVADKQPEPVYPWLHRPA